MSVYKAHTLLLFAKRRLFEVYLSLTAFYFRESKSFILVHHLGAFCTFRLVFHLPRDGNAVFIDSFQNTFEFFAIIGVNFHTVAHVVFILSVNLERLTYSRAAHFEFVILVIAIEFPFYEAAQIHTVVNPNTVLVVNFHHNAVVIANRKVGKKLLLSFQPFVNYALNFLFVYHCFRPLGL